MTGTTTIYRMLFVSVILGVGILSVVPTDAIPSEFTFWDKAQHTLGFIVLTLLGLMAYGRTRRGLLLWILGYGALIEIVQHFLPWRDGDVLDFLADALGVAVVIGAIAAICLRKKKHSTLVTEVARIASPFVKRQPQSRPNGTDGF